MVSAWANQSGLSLGQIKTKLNHIFNIKWAVIQL
jgi:hypothetical protein